VVGSNNLANSSIFFELDDIDRAGGGDTFGDDRRDECDERGGARGGEFERLERGRGDTERDRERDLERAAAGETDRERDLERAEHLRRNPMAPVRGDEHFKCLQHK